MAQGDSTPAAARFGTFGGVFTPCTLTILGVIMFLRFGRVVGQAGVGYAFLIVACAAAITTLTALSLSAVATNTRVKGGGAYFLISRSLGPEFGGAIGVVFFLAQAISVAMYVIGFSEAFADAFPAAGLSVRTTATITNVAVFVCVFIGAGWTIKVQYVILGALGLALISFFGGGILQANPETLRANLAPDYQPGQNLFTMFALFFPAVTGIMAGANMSGDLKDPARSIPRGTVLAIVVTTAIYLAIAVVFGASRPRDELVANTLVIKDIAFSSALITVGIFAATLSSALGSMMGSPRILQAFARDRIWRWLSPLARGSGPSNEPRMATVLTFLISQVCILLGDLNMIAPIITMAFLITYGMLNLATFYESFTSNPSYRPRFRFSHWSLSLLGAGGCAVVMFLLSPMWAAVSIVAVVGLYRLIRSQEVQARWGDVKGGYLFERTRRSLLRLEDVLYHAKNWRPIVLAFSGAGWTRVHLAVYGHWFVAGRGLLTLGQVITGELEDRAERRANQERILYDFIKEQGLGAFPAVVVADGLTGGIEALIQCQGLGPLRPNTVLLGWPRDSAKNEVIASTLRVISRLNQNIVLVRTVEDPEDPWQEPAGTIDVWWRGKGNGSLMLLLAHLLACNDVWKNRRIRLIRAVGNDVARDEVTRHLNELIEISRIPATPVVITAEEPLAALRNTSRNAAIVFVGFEPPEEGDEVALFEHVEAMIQDLPNVVLVHSKRSVELET